MPESPITFDLGLRNPNEINAALKAELLIEFPWVTSVAVARRQRDGAGWRYRVEGTRHEAGKKTDMAAVRFWAADATGSAPLPPA